MKTIKQILIPAVILFLALAGCGGANDPNGAYPEETHPSETHPPEAYPSVTQPPGVIPPEFHLPPDLTVQGEEFTDGVYRITRGGRFIFSGNFVGQILIEAARSDVVELVFDGITLHNPYAPAIYAPSSQRVEIILPEGTVNTVSDGAQSGATAAIFIQHDLSISGSGTLNVIARYNSGIRSQDYLTITGGVINVTSAGDALRGRDGVVIEGGSLMLNAQGDGISSNHDANPRRGFVTIYGGNIDITAGDDGIQAVTAVTINGGNVRITAQDDGITAAEVIYITGGSVNIVDSHEGMEARNITVSGGVVNVFSRDDGINARGTGAYIRVSGGDVTIFSNRDALETDGNVYVQGGTLRLGGAAGRTPDGSFVITGGGMINSGNSLTISAQSPRPLVSTIFRRPHPAGTVAQVRNAEGAVLLTHTAPNPFVLLVFSAEEFAIGERFFLYLNNERTAEITLNARITNITL